MSETNLANDALVTDLNRMVASQYPPTWDSGQFRSISRYDIDLLKRWDTRTVFTMGTYSISLCYQLTVSKEATQHPYLFHAALAMAAMHDGSLQVSREPSSTNNSQATQYYHHSCAAALFNHRLSRSVDKPADHNAIWATASMLGNMASFSIKTYDPELAWPMAPSTDSSLGWMEMHKGVYTVYKMASPGDPGGMFHAIINDPQYTFLKNKWDEDTREGTEDIPPQFVALCDLDPSSNAQNNPYHATVRGLAAIWDMECTQDTALRFISIISLMRPEMSALLMQKDARALLLLAYWFTKMFHVHWWFQQRCFVECAAICMYLKRYYHSDPLIMDMVQYPLSRLEAAFSDPERKKELSFAETIARYNNDGNAIDIDLGSISTSTETATRDSISIVCQWACHALNNGSSAAATRSKRAPDNSPSGSLFTLLSADSSMRTSLAGAGWPDSRMSHSCNCAVTKPASTVTYRFPLIHGMGKCTFPVVLFKVCHYRSSPATKEGSSNPVDSLSFESLALDGDLTQQKGRPATMLPPSQPQPALNSRPMVLALPTIVTETRQNPPAAKHSRDVDEMAADADVERSMARRKKNEPPMDINKKCSHCDKVFKRPCDFTKHEKTHSRPWKCTQPDCKYFSIGWPTEKERDRHVNDRHSENPPEYRCKFSPCTYTSKRESNCKQHMEKAHGWQYVRSKNNGKRGKTPSSAASVASASQTPPTPAMSTPVSSLSTELPSPASGQMISPYFPNMPHDFAIYDPPAMYEGYVNMSTGEPFNFADPPMVPGLDFQLFPDSTDMDTMSLDALPSNADFEAFGVAMEASDPSAHMPPPSADMSLDQLGQDQMNPYCFDSEFLNYQPNNNGMPEY
ncbi:hypothetical protein UA08_06709 [Talaromyces atroroseus]|uniref:C2H2-type domain-containing protein n=1 Tax=Talaromyces atroroseus TaxID=1441469 RepID=A0A225AQJ1_TALAT|nr:hypothetical protein UA08_06709 [Talaromyces atroroseus]OKL57879.1 hypothetical protein UA08_06709 [Talaromyces atroroseus]